MTQRGKQLDINDFLRHGCRNNPYGMATHRCIDCPTHDMGGTTGGERERALSTTPEVDVVAAIVRDPAKWGPPTEPEVFWLHWQSDYMVERAMARLAQDRRSEDAEEPLD